MEDFLKNVIRFINQMEESFYIMFFLKFSIKLKFQPMEVNFQWVQVAEI